MKGLILLFISISVFGCVWGYLQDETKASFKATVRKNLLPITLAFVAVCLAIFVSLNSTVRFV